MNTNPVRYELPLVPAHRIEKLDKRVEQVNRRAAKLGLPPISYKILEDVVVEIPGVMRSTKALKHRIEFSGEAPVVSGWELVAKAEHTDAGALIKKSPCHYDTDIPNSLTENVNHCDHCGKVRRRNDTFLLCHTESKKYIRVGRACLKDFLDASVASVVGYWSVVHEIESWAGDGEGSYEMVHDTTHFVACAFSVVRQGGWVSRKQSEDSGFQATAGAAAFAALPPSTKWTEEQKAAWRKKQPTDADKQQANDALAWIRGLDTNRDYEHNLKVACSLEYTQPKNEGIVASVTQAYIRMKAWELKRAERAARPRSEFFGIVGEKYMREVTVDKVFGPYDGAWGASWITILTDSEGHVFKRSGDLITVRTQNSDDPALEGHKVWVCFTVKKHAEWKGDEQTLITRTAGFSVRPTAGFKWVGPDGRIFKTKKAMLSTEAK